MRGRTVVTEKSTTRVPATLREVSIPLFSADSHVIEEPSLWDGVLPKGYFPPRGNGGGKSTARAGRVDPVARVDEMGIDGVVGEILYPTLGLGLFSLDDPETQERAFEVYNSWLIDFCKVSPGKLYGIGLISTYDIENAITELKRCADRGLIGCEIWQTPHPELPFFGQHYEPFWEAAAALSMPVSLHILTGFNYSKIGSDRTGGFKDPIGQAIQKYKNSVNEKLKNVSDSLLEIMFSGVLDRHPSLKIVLVENEIGWLPFLLDQFDYYTDRYEGVRPTLMSKQPSAYFGSQVFSTFFRDPIGTKMLGWWGSDGCMWSSDYPHPNSTWPHSQRVVAENLGYLDDLKLQKIVRANAYELYGIGQSG